MVCATLPESPLASSSDREARKMACGVCKRSEQLVRFAGAEAGDQAQGEPVEFFFFGEGRGKHGGLLWCRRAGNFSGSE